PTRPRSRSRSAPREAGRGPIHCPPVSPSPDPQPDPAATGEPGAVPGAASGASPLGAGAWVILPTYNERETIEASSAAILESLPGAVLLIVDDSSPDGTGELAEGLAT